MLGNLTDGSRKRASFSEAKIFYPRNKEPEDVNIDLPGCDTPLGSVSGQGMKDGEVVFEKEMLDEDLHQILDTISYDNTARTISENNVMSDIRPVSDSQTISDSANNPPICITPVQNEHTLYEPNTLISRSDEGDAQIQPTTSPLINLPITLTNPQSSIDTQISPHIPLSGQSRTSQEGIHRSIEPFNCPHILSGIEETLLLLQGIDEIEEFSIGFPIFPIDGF